MYRQHIQPSMDHLVMVANPARGELNRETSLFPCPRLRLRIWSRETGLAASARSFSTLRANLIGQSGAYSWLPPAFRGGVRLYRQPPSSIGPISSLSGHAAAHRWCLPPRVRRHKATSPQGSSSNGCCLFKKPHIDRSINIRAPRFPHPLQQYSYVQQ